MSTPPKHLGAKHELQACTWLLEQGYDVFRNVSPYGPIDLVAVKGDELLKIDVKSSNAASALSKAQWDAGIIGLSVGDAGCHFMKARYPIAVECPECHEMFQKVGYKQEKIYCSSRCRGHAALKRRQERQPTS